MAVDHPEAPKKLRDYLPSPFLGQELSKENCESHILKFQDYIAYQELEDYDEIERRFKLTLEGKARLWIENEQFQNFEDLRDSFVIKFSPPKTTFQLMKDYEELKYAKNDDFEHFIDNLQKLGKQLKYSDEHIKNKFLLALPKECQKFLMITKTEGNLKEWTAAARSFLNIEEAPGPNEQYFATQAPEPSPPERPPSNDQRSTEEYAMKDLQEEVYALREKLRNLEEAANARPVADEFRKGVLNFSGNTQSAIPQEYNGLYGYNNRNNIRNSRGNYCDNENNRRNYDSAKSGRNFNSVRNIVCYHCRETGHKWRFCPKRRFDTRRREEMASPRNQNFR